MAFTSRALTPTERNYAQIGKELLAIVYACDRFVQYVFRRNITVVSDQKPLEVILQKPLLSAPKRFQQMMMRLQKYNIESGIQTWIADTLSRAYLTSPSPVDKEEEEFIRAVEKEDMIKHLPVSPERLKELGQKTQEDATLEDLKKNIKMEWPEKKYEVLQGTRAYYNFCDELSVQDDIIFKGERVVVPTVMRSQMLKKIHSSHIGTEGCLRRAREALF